MNPAASKWGSSGLAYLTGLPDGPPDFSRANVLARADQVAGAIGARTGVDIDVATLLSGRAGLLGLTRQGRVSAGGATRLLAAGDGWCALTLSRPDDLAAIPALLEADEAPTDHWAALERWAARRCTAAITERAGMLDIPAAALAEATPTPPRVHRTGPRTMARGLAGLLVADLSSMWAGPLCGHLMQCAGATVVKVESPRRPDGTRAGNRGFFDWMNSGKLSYCVDFDDPELRMLLAASDIVIEGSRPAALARRGLGPDDVPARPGRIWLRLTGYDAHAGRPAFGDDAAVAGGLVGTSIDGPVFCGDAIADPLAGLEATLAVVESLGRGGGELIGVPMAAVAATYAALPTGPSVSTCPTLPPQAPPEVSPAAELGADNNAVRLIVSERHCVSC